MGLYPTKMIVFLSVGVSVDLCRKVMHVIHHRSRGESGGAESASADFFFAFLFCKCGNYLSPSM